MAKTLAELKKSKTERIQRITEEAKKASSSQFKDDRYWKPTVDKAGNGTAVIRFLDAPQGEDVPFVKLWRHNFKGSSGLVYNEISLTTIGQPDPVTELNSRLWETGDTDTARRQKRNLEYHSNILVVKDPGNPDNEGKVFLYQYGKKIFEKIMQSLEPQFEDDEPVNVFDMWNGANFKLRIRNVKEYRNYDMAEFDKPSPVAKTDEEIEAIWKKCHSLQEIVSPDKFKTYDELKDKLTKVLDLDGAAPAPVKASGPKKAPVGKTFDDSEDSLDEDFNTVFKSLKEDDE